MVSVSEEARKYEYSSLGVVVFTMYRPGFFSIALGDGIVETSGVDLWVQFPVSRHEVLDL